jgi:hypothetical protein
MKRTFRSMLNLMMGCLSRSQENSDSRKWDFFQMAGFERFENLSFWKLIGFEPQFFFVKSCSFLRTEINNNPSNFTGNTIQCISIDWYQETHSFPCCMSPWTLQEAPQKRLIEVILKKKFYFRKTDFLGISRWMKSASRSMLKLMVSCLSRSQENWDLKKWDFTNEKWLTMQTRFHPWEDPMVGIWWYMTGDSVQRILTNQMCLRLEISQETPSPRLI